MSDINLLPTDNQPRDEKGGSGKKTVHEDMTLHVPASEPKEKPAASPLSGTFLSHLIESEKAAAAPSDKLFSQKIEAIPSAPTPKPTPKPSTQDMPLKSAPAPAKPSSPKPPTPPPAPPTPPPPMPPKQEPPEEEKDNNGTLRVSLITANGGAGLSDIVLRKRLRIFAAIGALGVLVDGMIFGGLKYAKASLEKRNQQAVLAVQDVDARIEARENEMSVVRDFQALSKAGARVLDAHAHWTGVLKLLEERALPDVQFGSLAGAETGTLGFEVIARDYTTLAKQIVAFREDPRVRKVNVGTASADVGENNLLKGVRATMSLVIDPKIFRYVPEAAASLSQEIVTVPAEPVQQELAAPNPESLPIAETPTPQAEAPTL